MIPITRSRTVLRTTLRYAFALTLLLACTSSRASAQSATDGATPSGMAPGAPAGSYQLSGFDNVNFYNGHLNFSLPLLKVGGRGGAQIPVLIPIEQPWRVEYQGNETYAPVPNWRVGEAVGDILGFSPGSLDARLAGEGLDYWPCPSGINPQAYYGESLTRLTFTAPDGTE